MKTYIFSLRKKHVPLFFIQHNNCNAPFTDCPKELTERHQLIQSSVAQIIIRTTLVFSTLRVEFKEKVQSLSSHPMPRGSQEKFRSSHIFSKASQQSRVGDWSVWALVVKRIKKTTNSENIERLSKARYCLIQLIKLHNLSLCRPWDPKVIWKDILHTHMCSGVCALTSNGVL